VPDAFVVVHGHPRQLGEKVWPGRQPRQQLDLFWTPTQKKEHVNIC
jgi:hypothetical protein